MKTHSRVLASAMTIVGIATLGSCKSDKFGGGVMPPRKIPAEPTVVPSQPPPPPQIPTGSVMIGCSTSRSEAPLGNTSAKGVPVSFDRICADEIVTSEQVQQKRLADIVFVLDVTKSMQPNIDTVKENIFEFASKVSDKGWDVRYAAVAFRDPPDSSPLPEQRNNPDYELIYATGFMDQSALRAELSSGRGEWTAMDRSDNQEGGQYGINAGLSLLRTGRREQAEAIILYVSDAPAFRDKDHWDFSVQETAARMAAMSNFRFFHSTLAVDDPKYSSLPSDSRWRGDASFRIAKNQMDEMLRQSGKPGGWLRFPLDRSTFLGNFAEQFDTVWNKVALDCFVQEAVVKDSQGNLVLRLQNPGSAEFLMGSIPLQFEGAIPKAGAYTYSDRRCCVRRPASSVTATCEKSRETTAAITIR